MRIHYFHQYFKEPEEGGAIRSYHLSKGLASKGHKVILISAHNQKYLKIKRQKNLEIYWLPVPYDNSFSKTRRILSFINFLFSAYFFSAKLPKPDVNYLTSTPLTIGLIGLARKLFNKTRYVFEIRDIWPDAAIQLGFLKSKFLIMISKKLEKLIYKKSELVIGLSADMTKHVNSICPEISTITIPNFADNEYFKSVSKDLNFPISICYAGTFSYSKNLDQHLLLLEESAAFGSTFSFTYAGEGSLKSDFEKEIVAKGFLNVRFLPFLNKDGIQDLFQKSHFSLVTFREEKILESSSPNKFFDSLAAGLPPIVNTNGWLKDLIQTQNCGIYWEKGKERELLEELISIFKNKEKYKEMAANARNIAENQFSVKDAIKQLNDELEQIYKKSSVSNQSEFQ